VHPCTEGTQGTQGTHLRIALIGYGHGGAIFHAPLIAATKGMRLAAIVTHDPGRQARARGEFPHAAILDSPLALWARASELDLVVIAAPNRFHVPLALDALSVRLPVVVDKPLGVTVGEARAVAGRFADAGVLLTVFHNRRWDGDFLTLQQIVRDGRLGELHRFESRFERWRPDLRGVWRESADPADGGGLLLDLGSHLIDQALVLFGPVVDVYAEIDSRRSAGGADDETFVALRHESGVRSHLWMSALAAHAGPRFRLLGSRGAFVKRGMDVQEDALRSGMRPGDPGWGADPRERWGEIRTGATSETVPTRAGSYESFYADVVRAMAGAGGAPVTAAEALAVLEVVESARRRGRGRAG
jgi:predicted dehydrogenase